MTSTLIDQINALPASETKPSRKYSLEELTAVVNSPSSTADLAAVLGLTVKSTASFKARAKHIVNGTVPTKRAPKAE